MKTPSLFASCVAAGWKTFWGDTVSGATIWYQPRNKHQNKSGSSAGRFQPREQNWDVYRRWNYCSSWASCARCKSKLNVTIVTVRLHRKNKKGEFNYPFKFGDPSNSASGLVQLAFLFIFLSYLGIIIIVTVKAHYVVVNKLSLNFILWLEVPQLQLLFWRVFVFLFFLMFIFSLSTSFVKEVTSNSLFA